MSVHTLTRWRKKGLIKAERFCETGHWVFDVDNIPSTEGIHREHASERISIIYARVSTRKQIPHLQTQIDILQQKYPEHMIIKDVGSGLNFKRKGLLQILELVLSGRVQEVCVTHKDRICRFAYDLLQHIFKRSGTTPSKVRARAVKQLVDAQHINLKEKGFGNFHLRFRSFRKDPTGTIILEKAFARDNGPLHHFSSYHGSRHSNSTQKKYGLMHMAPSSFSEVNNAILIRDHHWLMDKLIEDGKLKEDGKIMWDKRTDSWYLIVLIDKEVKKKISVDEGRGLTDLNSIVSLDPGVRSFNTLYSPDGTHGELLSGALKVAMGMCKKMDDIKSTAAKKKDEHTKSLHLLKNGDIDGLSNHVKPADYFLHRRRLAHLNHRFHKISSQLRNWRCNAHYDAINFLIGRYNHVLIPEFQTQRMSARAERNISSKTARSMYTMSHFMFRSRLMAKAELDENKTVRVIGEPGTSKTCGNCGYWNSDLGSKKTYSCPECAIVLDRDINGARNNMIALIK